MLRRYVVVNLVFSLLSTAAVMALMPTAGSVMLAAHAGFQTYAKDSALLSPLVFGTISLR
ncbi:MAG: hypothetical protein ABL907_02490 [Hyphomicrobium sp.]